MKVNRADRASVREIKNKCPSVILPFWLLHKIEIDRSIERNDHVVNVGDKWPQKLIGYQS
jgi:hypothetical protein